MSEVSEGKLVCAALEKVWRAVADMVIDFRSKGVPIPHTVSTSLDGAKVLINLCKYHPKLAHDIGPSEINAVQGICVNCCGADIVARIECEIRNVEDLMIPKAVNAGLGDEYIMQWQNRVRECWVEVGKRKQAPLQR